MAVVSEPAEAATAARSEADAWERWAPLWEVLLDGSLALALVLSLPDPALRWPRHVAVIALALGLAGWYRAHAARARARDLAPAEAARTVAVAVLLWAPLPALHPAFLFALTGLYPIVYTTLPLRRAAVAATAVTGLLAWRLAALQGGLGSPARAAGLALTMVATLGAGFLLARFLTAVIAQSGERHRLIERLRAAQAQLAEAERHAGALAERQRLAAELHDTITQDLASIAMQLEVAEAVLRDDPERAAKHLAAARAAAREALAQARRLGTGG